MCTFIILTDKLKPAEYKYLAGVERETLKVMVSILRTDEKTKRKRGGNKSKLSIEVQLGEFWRSLFV